MQIIQGGMWAAVRKMDFSRERQWLEGEIVCHSVLPVGSEQVIVLIAAIPIVSCMLIVSQRETPTGTMYRWQSSGKVFGEANIPSFDRQISGKVCYIICP